MMGSLYAPKGRGLLAPLTDLSGGLLGGGSDGLLGGLLGGSDRP
jgi:hypothetical protein